MNSAPTHTTNSASIMIANLFFSSKATVCLRTNFTSITIANLVNGVHTFVKECIVHWHRDRDVYFYYSKAMHMHTSKSGQGNYCVVIYICALKWVRIG